MILYLRIVHSFDFYSAVEYPNEDEMPHRCGIMHARGPPPPNRITQNDGKTPRSPHLSPLSLTHLPQGSYV